MHELLHDLVGALQVEQVAISLLIVEDDAHALVLARKGKVVEYVVGLLESVGIANLDAVGIALEDAETQQVCDLDECNLIRRRSLVGSTAVIAGCELCIKLILIRGSDVVTQRQRSHQVSQDGFLLAFDALSLPLLDCLLVKVLSWVGLQPALLQQDILHALLIILREGGLLQRQLLEYHVILRQCASLVTEQVPDSTQRFRNVRVTSDRPSQLHILVDVVRVDQLGELHIHPHRYGDDVAQQDQVANVGRRVGLKTERYLAEHSHQSRQGRHHQEQVP